MKKNSSFLIIAILLVLIGVSLYVYKSKSKLSTVDGDDRAFGVKDTAAITKIFIADKEGHKATVERKKGTWLVNDKFNCRPDAILNLLEVIRNVEVKMPVDKLTRKSVIKFMSSKALKVEIYNGDDLVKQYYVGQETQDGEGSYMLLTDIESGENYKDPYICFIPGFQGYLLPRYIADENEWRDRLVLNYIPPQIKQIKVTQSDFPPDSSFTIDLASSSQFKLKDGKGRELQFDEMKMKQYLAYFQNISYENLITGRNQKLQDSLTNLKPFCILTIIGADAVKKDFKFFRKQFEGQRDPEHGINYSYDPDRMFVRFEGDKQWALCQYFVFGKILITPNYFSPPQSVKK